MALNKNVIFPEQKRNDHFFSVPSNVKGCFVIVVYMLTFNFSIRSYRAQIRYLYSGCRYSPLLIPLLFPFLEIEEPITKKGNSRGIKRGLYLQPE